MDSIAIGDQSIPYVFIEKPWIRNSYLRFDDHKLIVTARNFRNAAKVVNMHKDWIVKHYTQVKRSIKLFSSTSNSILFNGNPFEVQHVPYEGRTKLEIIQNKIFVHSKSTETADKAMDKWLALQTKLFADPVVIEKVKILGKDVPRTGARRCGKWGVCKSNNTITFNSYLCMLPADIREYIISHEVAHLSQINHSSRFWEVVSTLCPNYKELRKRLKDYDNKRRSVYLPMNFT